jgi:hypothetical protein
MAETHRYTLIKPARLLFSSITAKSAPRNIQGAMPKFSGTFGIEKEDFDKIVAIMVQGIKEELGSFSGNPNDYYLAERARGKGCVALGRSRGRKPL